MSHDWIKEKQPFFQIFRTFFDGMTEYDFSPHFDCFPFPKSVEKVKAFYLLIILFFRYPLFQFYKLNWLAIYIITQPFLADRIILSVQLFIDFSICIIFNHKQFIWIFLFLRFSLILRIHQIQKLFKTIFIFQCSSNITLKSNNF